MFPYSFRQQEHPGNLFERGQMLIRYCTNKLDQAELKIQQISGDELVDFSPDNREIS